MSVIVLLFLAACSSGAKKAKQNTKESVPVTRLTKLDTTLYTDYVAAIQASKNTELRSRLNGFLSHIYVDEGEQVQKGQVLFRINDEEQRMEVGRALAALKKAEAEAKTATVETQRVKLLVEKDIVSKTELDVAKAQLRAAQATIEEAKSALEKAKTHLSYTTIRAPFSGRIDRIYLKEGSLLSEGSLLTKISDLNEVYAYFDMSETEYLNRVSAKSLEKDLLGNKVTLMLANGKEYAQKGVLELAESQFEEQTGSIAFRARFSNPDKLLKHGATGKIRLPSRITGQLAVPQKSVFEIQDRTYVYVVNGGNKIKMTSFSAGRRFGHFYLVKDGLKAGDKIVYEGTQSLKDGAEVVPIPVSLDSLLFAGAAN